MNKFNDWIKENKNHEQKFVKSVMNKYGKSMPPIDKNRYTAIKGLEGPFRSKNGKVVYYDPKEGKYYDRDSDMYLDNDVMEMTNVTAGQDVSQRREIRRQTGSVGSTLLLAIDQAIQQIAASDPSKANNLLNKMVQVFSTEAPEYAAIIRSKKSSFLSKAGQSPQPQQVQPQQAQQVQPQKL